MNGNYISIQIVICCKFLVCFLIDQITLIIKLTYLIIIISFFQENAKDVLMTIADDKSNVSIIHFYQTFMYIK